MPKYGDGVAMDCNREMLEQMGDGFNIIGMTEESPTKRFPTREPQ